MGDSALLKLRNREIAGTITSESAENSDGDYQVGWLQQRAVGRPGDAAAAVNY